MLYFNSQHLHSAQGEYVAWCDGMGTGRALVTSLHHAANFIFKLHRAFSIAIDNLAGGHAVRVYPLMDGMYITTPVRQQLQTVLRTAFVELAREFNLHDELTDHFIVRGGIAYGATIHGAAINADVFIQGIGTAQEAGNRAALQASRLNQTRSHLLLSSAMVPAYNSESLAPPFGLYVDDSALSVPQLVNAGDNGFPSRFWKWWLGDAAAQNLAHQLWPNLNQYFVQAEQRQHEIGYPKDNLVKHRDWAREYFREFEQVQSGRSVMRRLP